MEVECSKKEKIENWAFTHVIGPFYYELMTEISPFELVDFEIVTNSNKTYTFDLLSQNGQVKTVLNIYTTDRGCGGGVDGNRLYPYYGGDEVAPHEVYIWVSERNALSESSEELPLETLLVT